MLQIIGNRENNRFTYFQFLNSITYQLKTINRQNIQILIHTTKQNINIRCISQQSNNVHVCPQQNSNIYIKYIRINQRLMSSIPSLCKITFTLNNNPIQQANNQLNNCIQQDQVIVYHGMSIYDIVLQIGNKIGCGYQQIIQNLVRNQLNKILKQGSGVKKTVEEQTRWRFQMQKILGIQHQGKVLKDNDFNCTAQNTQYSKIKYFKTNYDKIIKTRSQKQLVTNLTIQQNNGIYQRSLAKRKKTQQKLCMIKKNKQNQQIQQCTFTPNINDTYEFFIKKNPTFFNGKDLGKKQMHENTFEKLYKQSFDIKQKRNQRIKTIQNQEEIKISQLSFVPQINQCSRQICRMKSYASFIQEISENNQKQKQELPQKSCKISKNNTIKKQMLKLYTFHPQISENTKRMTKNLPSFYQRLQRSLQKKQQKLQKLQKNTNLPPKYNKNQNLNQSKKVEKPQKVEKFIKQNKIKLKKQLYTIDFQEPEQQEIQTQKKKNNNQTIILDTFENTAQKINHMLIEQSNQNPIKQNNQLKKQSNNLSNSNISNKVENRSRQLFDNRKRTILQAIIKYISVKPFTSISQFSKNQFHLKLTDNFQICDKDLDANPYIPMIVKQMLSPITDQLRQVQVSLSKEQFLLALQTLFQGLSISDRGSLLGWGIKLLPS